MTKNEAYITEDSFGAILPESWEYAAQYMNTLIDALPEDEYGEIDRDAVSDIWERYCNGDYNDDMAANADADQLDAMIRDWRSGGNKPTQAMLHRLNELHQPRFVNDDEYRIEERADADGTRITVYTGEKSKVFRSWQMKDYRREAMKYCEELEAEGYHRRLGQMEKDLAAMSKEEKIATAERMARQKK